MRDILQQEMLQLLTSRGPRESITSFQDSSQKQEDHYKLAVKHVDSFTINTHMDTIVTKYTLPLNAFFVIITWKIWHTSYMTALAGKDEKSPQSLSRTSNNS